MFAHFLKLSLSFITLLVSVTCRLEEDDLKYKGYFNLQPGL